MRELSLKNAIFALLCAVYFCACLESLDLNEFLESDEIQEYIERISGNFYLDGLWLPFGNTDSVILENGDGYTISVLINGKNVAVTSHLVKGTTVPLDIVTNEFYTIINEVTDNKIKTAPISGFKIYSSKNGGDITSLYNNDNSVKDYIDTFIAALNNVFEFTIDGSKIIAEDGSGNEIEFVRGNAALETAFKLGGNWEANFTNRTVDQACDSCKQNGCIGAAGCLIQFRHAKIKVEAKIVSKYIEIKVSDNRDQNWGQPIQPTAYAPWWHLLSAEISNISSGGNITFSNVTVKDTSMPGVPAAAGEFAALISGSANPVMMTFKVSNNVLSATLTMPCLAGHAGHTVCTLTNPETVSLQRLISP